jgi:hypothetical protein
MMNRMLGVDWADAEPALPSAIATAHAIPAQRTVVLMPLPSSESRSWCLARSEELSQESHVSASLQVCQAPM